MNVAGLLYCAHAALPQAREDHIRAEHQFRAMSLKQEIGLEGSEPLPLHQPASQRFGSGAGLLPPCGLVELGRRNQAQRPKVREQVDSGRMAHDGP